MPRERGRLTQIIKRRKVSRQRDRRVSRLKKGSQQNRLGSKDKKKSRLRVREGDPLTYRTC